MEHHLNSNFATGSTDVGLYIFVLLLHVAGGLLRRLNLKELQAAMRDLDLVARRVDVVSMMSAHGDGRTVDWKQLSIELSNHFMIQGRMV